MFDRLDVHRFVKEKEHHFSRQITPSDGTLKLFLLSEKEDYVNESNILLMFPAVKRGGRKS